MSEEERQFQRRHYGGYGPAGVPIQGFGSAGVQPRRNPNFTSEAGFNSWKSKHPKAPHTGKYLDIDEDGVPEYLVENGDHQVVAVNGWELKPSKWKYEQRHNYGLVNPQGQNIGTTDLWTSRASKKIAYQSQFVDEDMKGIFSKFGKAVVKPVFLAMFPDRLSPPTKRAGSDGPPKPRTASWFYKDVARVLVGNQLDAEMIQAGAQDIAQRWGPNRPSEEALKNTLHRSKLYKQQFKARLGAYVHTLGNPGVRDTVRQAIDGVGQFGGDLGHVLEPPPVVLEAAQGVLPRIEED
jgi:hypothetical protein